MLKQILLGLWRLETEELEGLGSINAKSTEYQRCWQYLS